jgi:hypothetical protein
MQYWWTIGKFFEFARRRIINYYCRLLVTKCDPFRCNEITNLTMRDVEDLDSAIVVKVQDTKNYK